MSATDQLFCFTSNKIDSHFCPYCRAPMLVRSKSAGRNCRARTFECFNCAKGVVITDLCAPGIKCGTNIGNHSIVVQQKLRRGQGIT
jgi:hypothetical protein